MLMWYMKDLIGSISKQQTFHPDRAYIIAGDLNRGNLCIVLPRFCQRKCVKPTMTTKNVWLEGADSALQHQPLHTD